MRVVYSRNVGCTAGGPCDGSCFPSRVANGGPAKISEEKKKKKK